MVISASRRTDIPAFYSRWFMERIKVGTVDVANPFNPNQIRHVDLRPESVHAIVFWTRNPRPLTKFLPELDLMGYRYYFLYTITNYPKEIEPNVPSLKKTIETFKMLSDIIGPDRAIWRYDPIILSSITNADFHRGNFLQLALCLEGLSNRIIISFLNFYKKTERRLNDLSANKGIEWNNEHSVGTDLYFMKELKEISDSYGFTIHSCAEEHELKLYQINPGRCIDNDLLNRLFGLSLPHRKDVAQREKCLCDTSVDIGAYNTCGYRCIYCYANSSFDSAASHLRIFSQNAVSLSPAPKKY
jgi:DNA repair photolyase